MWGAIANIFTGGATKAISDIATEWIDTDKESAEAKAIMVKTLDPNGNMRRQISKTVSSLYTTYIALMMILVLLQSFKLGDIQGVETAIKNLVDLFVPITTSFTAIVGASFGVNGINAANKV